MVSNLTTPCYIFADDTNIPSVNMHQYQSDSLQMDLDTINSWCSEWLLFLNIKKCHVLHFGNKNQLSNKSKYNINGQVLEEVIVEKDLGVYVTSDLNWDKQVSHVCSKANFWFKMISKCFVFKSKDLIRKLYITLIRPKLEYANAIWSPTSKKPISMLEKVQKRCTKVGPLRNLTYTERLKELCLTTLEIRRRRGDLISMFRYFKGFDKINFVNPPKILVSRTRGHKFKLEKENINHCARQNFLFNRATNEWNSFPKFVVEVNAVVEF